MQQAYVFKTQPFPHQEECFNRSKDMEVFAILFEQGAGKSKVIVDTAAYLYGLGRIEALVVVAPNGVHKKWLREDFPFSFPDYCEFRGAAYEAGSKKALQACENLYRQGSELRVLCVNVEAFSHKSGVEFLKRFLQTFDCMLVVDESSRIKNPDAVRTKNLCKLGDLAKYKRILTGTPVTNSPFDYYSQFMFLDRDIFGCSFFTFKAEYAEMLSADDRLMQAIMRKSGARFAPQVVAKDFITGKPMYRNLDKLKEIISPFSMRVTKDEANLHLPPKIYQKRYCKLAKDQRALYDALVEDQKAEFGDSTLTVLHKMTLTLRRQQITSGFFPTDDRTVKQLFEKPEDNPRIQCLLDTIEDLDGPIIIWCRFQEEIRQICKVLGDQAVAYYGEVDGKTRQENMEAFKRGEKRFFVGNAVVGGIGLNLTISAAVIYYSNTFSYEDRKQSEDRVHRIGQEKDSVLYVDIQAEETVDEEIVSALLSKEDLATFMTDFSAWK